MPRSRRTKKNEQDKDAIEKKAVDLRIKRVETKLSKFGALVALASNDVVTSKETAVAAEERLIKLQKELEQLYIILGEPFYIE